MSLALEAAGLTKRFPQGRRFRDLLLHPLAKRLVTVLEDVSLEVHRGEVFGLLGPNGAGKTTLIKIFCTLVLPDAGVARVNGLDVRAQGKAIRRTIGYVIGDERSFYWRLTGRQNLRFFATLNNLSRLEADERIGELLRLTGLEAHADRMFKDYSTGMRQRLAVARGLLKEPDILFLDEPTKSLDPIASQDLRRFIRERLVEGDRRTVVLCTNNMREAADLCRRVAVLHGGRVRACGTLEEIQQTLAGRERYCLRLHGPHERSLGVLRGALPGDEIDAPPPDTASHDGLLFRVHLSPGRSDISHVVEALVRGNIQVQGCWREEIPLDEIFRRLVG